MVVEIEVREGERDEREEPQALVAKINGAAKSQGHERGKVRERGDMQGGDPPTGGQHDENKREGHDAGLGPNSMRDKSDGGVRHANRE